MANDIAEKVITVDGPAGSGKSTVSRKLAKRLNRVYLDTGALYRAVALMAKRSGLKKDDAKKLRKLCSEIDLHFDYNADPPKLYLGEENITEAIRSPEMDLLSSTISAVRDVRNEMAHLQRRMAEQAPVVAEGRDMGTVVFPEAKNKFFLTASVKTRAERRYNERMERGEPVSLAVVENELKKRDLQDETRTIAPLKPAKDAIVVDSTHLSPDQVVEEILGHIKATKKS
ncbi:(d)CMP kinase [Thermodesulfobacteriota bacterium]